MTIKIKGVNIDLLTADELERMENRQLIDLVLCLKQECEELKEQLERADEDIKMKCTRYAMTNQLDEQLEAYKMEAEEGKEINAELKAEKEKIEQCIIEQNRLVVGMTKEIETLTFKKYELLQTLTEIKEIAEEYQKEYLVNNGVVLLCNQILQKINEVVE